MCQYQRCSFTHLSNINPLSFFTIHFHYHFSMVCVPYTTGLSHNPLYGSHSLEKWLSQKSSAGGVVRSVCVFQCDVPHQWIAQRQVGPVSVYCRTLGCQALCLRHGIPVWQHIGQSTTATSRHRRDMTSDIYKRRLTQSNQATWFWPNQDVPLRPSTHIVNVRLFFDQYIHMMCECKKFINKLKIWFSGIIEVYQRIKKRCL